MPGPITSFNVSGPIQAFPWMRGEYTVSPVPEDADATEFPVVITLADVDKSGEFRDPETDGHLTSVQLTDADRIAKFRYMPIFHGTQRLQLTPSRGPAIDPLAINVNTPIRRR
jgi:hypothetical protein